MVLAAGHFDGAKCAQMIRNELRIQELQPGAAAMQKLFHGWMFASSPALNALEHPVYDVSVLDCSTASGSPAKPG